MKQKVDYLEEKFETLRLDYARTVANQDNENVYRLGLIWTAIRNLQTGHNPETDWFIRGSDSDSSDGSSVSKPGMSNDKSSDSDE